MAESNIKKLEAVAEGFGELLKDIVFVGGAVAELYADSPVPEEIRVTEDVDVVVKAVSKLKFSQFEEKLRLLGFKNDVSDNAPVCRWVWKGIKVDIMTVDSSVLGFGNIWYEKGFVLREKLSLGNGINIFIFPLAIYLATKLEAVKNRGLPDLRISHDFEDVVYLFDNCTDIRDLIEMADSDVRKYLSDELKTLSEMPVFKEAVLYCMPYGSQDNRISEIIAKIGSI